jgi:sulfite exporter TauE/SafE
MYIIVIGWLYVTLLVALTEGSLFAGILSFIFYGLAPTALLLWLTGSPARRRKSNAVSESSPDRRDTPPVQ